ncbi:hypothetical protein B5U98_07530 [Bosea sp. Tri-39]|nr:hypothetical protein BLM15_01615 [Bosea sp. Tri-49]RXT26536.1 hypothetical protein B5U98_07530 [Bosea sp. Tri-39]RXT33139.1 hypothetical protein B5U99_23075 [Bosea sp. Tri-54]
MATCAALAGAAERLGWRNLFLASDQRGRILLDRSQPAAAAEAFRDPLWRGIALFRAGDFKSAAQAFAALDTAESAYDQGNALVMLGQYEGAVKRYDRALALRPGWPDAATNREIARIRGERTKAEGGVNDDTESKPDEIVYDKTKKGGEDTTLQEPGKAMSDDAVRALWLKQVQTRPADFLRVKFSYQLQSAAERSGP